MYRLIQFLFGYFNCTLQVRAEDFSGLIGQIGNNLRKVLQASDNECSRISEQGSIDRSQVGTHDYNETHYYLFDRSASDHCMFTFAKKIKKTAVLLIDVTKLLFAFLSG